MAHVRTQIRDLLATRVTGLETCGSRVFKNRVKPLQQSDLPAINVSSGDEQIDRMTQNTPRRLGRLMQVHFDLIADADSDGAADTLDTIAAEIEAVMLEGSWSSALIFNVTPVSLTESYDGEGRKVVAQSRLTYEVEYHTAEGSAGSVLA
ncbi:hypothetical protein [Oceanicaulis sp.]|uniref:hypothetical protein n=1 Tax=Oceanicaulis sp. TaxID=1924941 RepID=UPI003D28EFDC